MLETFVRKLGRSGRMRLKKRSQMEKRRLELNIDNKLSKRGNRNRKIAKMEKYI